MLTKERAAAVKELAARYTDYTAENLSRLVRCPSPSCREEEAARELKRQMEGAGFDEVRIDPLGNVIGRIGTGKKVLALDAHIDTVEVGNKANWSFDPFSGEIREGYVHGRGSVDQKGGAASFVTAGRILKELGVPEGLTLLCTGTVIAPTVMTYGTFPGTPTVIASGPVLPAEATTTMPARQASMTAWFSGSSQ